MPSEAFISVVMFASVVFSVFEPQAETASAAPAMIEPVRTLEMIARIGSSLDIMDLERLAGPITQIGVDINRIPPG
ncbi:hypothetical protein, partial [uncultured Sphingomonas sp.]|uniref:hypothetical protein n=1 Tax=uncultured Sphingomonas sp. TaxID=158754 RepID=UPI0025F1A62E